MIMTFELNLDTVKVKHRAEYLDQRSFISEVIAQMYRHTHRTDCANWTTKVVGANRAHELGMTTAELLR